MQTGHLWSRRLNAIIIFLKLFQKVLIFFFRNFLYFSSFFPWNRHAISPFIYFQQLKYPIKNNIVKVVYSLFIKKNAVQFAPTLPLAWKGGLKEIAARFCVRSSAWLASSSTCSSSLVAVDVSCFLGKPRLSKISEISHLRLPYRVHLPSVGNALLPNWDIKRGNKRMIRTCFIAREMSNLFVFSTLMTDSKNGLATSRRLRRVPACDSPFFSWMISHLRTIFKQHQNSAYTCVGSVCM